jgi:hypothetical protein
MLAHRLQRFVVWRFAFLQAMRTPEGDTLLAPCPELLERPVPTRGPDRKKLSEAVILEARRRAQRFARRKLDRMVNFVRVCQSIITCTAFRTGYMLDPKLDPKTGKFRPLSIRRLAQLSGVNLRTCEIVIQFFTHLKVIYFVAHQRTEVPDETGGTRIVSTPSIRRFDLSYFAGKFGPEFRGIFERITGRNLEEEGAPKDPPPRSADQHAPLPWQRRRARRPIPTPPPKNIVVRDAGGADVAPIGPEVPPLPEHVAQLERLALVLAIKNEHPDWDYAQLRAEAARRREPPPPPPPSSGGDQS